MGSALDIQVNMKGKWSVSFQIIKIIFDEAAKKIQDDGSNEFIYSFCSWIDIIYKSERKILIYEVYKRFKCLYIY